MCVSHLCYVWCIQEGLTDLVECGIGQCRTLRKVTMGAGRHQTLTSSILKGMIQNPSLKQVELKGCDFEGRFYTLCTECIAYGLVSLTMRIMYYTVISIEWLCSVKCPFQVISSQCISSLCNISNYYISIKYKFAEY